MFLPQRLTFFHKQLEVSSYRTVCAAPLQSTVNCLFQPLCAQKYPLISSPLSCSQSLYKIDQDISCVHQYLDQYLKIKTTDLLVMWWATCTWQIPLSGRGVGRGCLIAGKTGIWDSCPIFYMGGGGRNWFRQHRISFCRNLLFLTWVLKNESAIITGRDSCLDIKLQCN